MKHLKWGLGLPVLAFPYGVLGVFCQPPLVEPSGLGLCWLVGLAFALVIFVMGRLGKWTARELALLSMIIKLAHIPMYILCFLFGMIAFLFGGPVLAFLWDTMTIILSGIIGLAAVLQGRKEAVLSKEQTEGYGVLQFAFCADIISAIVVYLTARKKREELL